MNILNIFKNPQAVILIAVALAFLFPQYGNALKPAILPSLAFCMLFSMKAMKSMRFSKENMLFSSKILFLNYIFFSGILVIASFFVLDKDYSIAFKMLAFGPPSVIVITLAYLIDADIEKAMFSEAIAYFAALIYTPLMVYLFFKSSVPVFELIKTILLLIAAPYIVSRFMKKISYDFKSIVNILVGFNIYIGIALAKDVISKNYLSLIYVSVLFAVALFLPMVLSYYLTKSCPKSIGALYTLFASQKNGNFALGLCLLFFSPKTAVPLAIYSLLSAVYVLCFVWLYKQGETQKTETSGTENIQKTENMQ